MNYQVISCPLDFFIVRLNCLVYCFFVENLRIVIFPGVDVHIKAIHTTEAKILIIVFGLKKTSDP